MEPDHLSTPRSSDEATVLGLVRAAGLPMSDAELVGLVAGYAPLRQGIDALYSVTEEFDDPPASVFDPAPDLDGWAS